MIREANEQKNNTNVYVFWNRINYITPKDEDILFSPYDDVNYSDETFQIQDLSGYKKYK